MKPVTVILLLIGCAFASQLPSWPKSWTVDQRQTQQMKDINAGQKSGQLSAKESEKLRRSLAHVARKKAKMRSKDNGKLNVEQTVSLNNGFDKVSSDISKTKQQAGR
jgi:hypothetical protein